MDSTDRKILAFVFGATGAVLIVIGVLVLFTSVSPSWFLLPLSWWVGAMMVWGYGKFLKPRTN